MPRRTNHCSAVYVARETPDLAQHAGLGRRAWPGGSGAGQRLLFVAAVSPDGGRLAVVQRSPEGALDIRVHDLARGTRRRPVWSPDGKQLYYRSLDGSSVFAVAVRFAPAFEAGRPSLLLDGAYEGPGGMPGAASNYDVAPDGRRFMVLRRDKNAPPRQIRIVSHWLAELKHRAASERR